MVAGPSERRSRAIRVVAATLAFALLNASFATPAVAQRSATRRLGAKDRRAVVDEIADLLVEQHLFPEVGKSCAEHIRSRLASGAYDDISDAMQFARTLTTDLRSVNDDAHLRVDIGPPDRFREGEGGEGDPEESRRRRAERFRRDNFGFRRFELLDGVTGYLDLTAFAPAEVAGDTAVAAMRLLANCRAVIIDLRDNSGGSGSMVQLIASYFFSEPTHLVSYQTRGEELIQQSWTLVHVPGKTLPKAPLFILTSGRTASAAEEFTYDMKHHGRATIIGETTAGGGHTAHVARVADTFNVVIPHGRPIHPVTGTDWDGVGVKPDIEVPTAEALLRARLEALSAVEARAHDGHAPINFQWAIEAVQAEMNPVKIPKATLRKYTGSYGRLTITMKGGVLYGRLGDESPRRLTPVTETRFCVEGLKHLRGEVVKDRQGDVVAIVTEFEDGRTTRVERTP